MKNLFNSIQLTKPKKNVFDLTHDVKLSLNMGELVPTMCMEVIPGDKFNISCESLLRFAPLVSPVMHRSDVYMHYFFIPNRILWSNWEKFITNTLVGGFLPAFPTYEINDPQFTRLMDYLGLPHPDPITGIPDNVSALPFAAYQAIYNEYYRDQNLVTAIDYTLNDGDNTSMTSLRQLRIRAWQHDYFTSALPFSQKGNPVNFPLAMEDVKVSILTNTPSDVGNDQTWTGLTPNMTDAYARAEESAVLGGADGKLFIKGSDVVGNTTINDLRRATRLQEWLEKAARGGSRYVENILSHFGVRSPDARLQRPEYITGTKSPVIISEVLNTSDTATAPQGNMAGHGISVTSGQYGNYFVQEHGYIMGIMSVMPKTAYQNGIPKHFLKTSDPFQYFWPSFANIGEQEVLNKEVFAYTSTGTDTFGYVPRYSEYKFEQNRVAGDFRTTLDFWHWGRIFATQPALNQAFIECVPDTRVFAVDDPDIQHLYAHVLHKIRAIRSMPKFGTPTF